MAVGVGAERGGQDFLNCMGHGGPRPPHVRKPAFLHDRTVVL